MKKGTFFFKQIADIHITSLPDDFLPSFGRLFLAKFYYYASISSSFKLYLRSSDERPVGFLLVDIDKGKSLLPILFRTWPYLALRISYSFKAFMNLCRLSLSMIFQEKEAKVYEGEPEIFSIAVDETFRGKGIGYLLVNEACEELRRIGFRKLTVKTLKYRNANTINFYKKCGFEISSELGFAGRKYVRLVKTI